MNEVSSLRKATLEAAVGHAQIIPPFSLTTLSMKQGVHTSFERGDSIYSSNVTLVRFECHQDMY